MFNGLGYFPGEYNIRVKDNSGYIINPPRLVAESIKNELSKTLVEMCKEGVIVEVERPRDWSSNVVIAEKPNKTLRNCLDLIELNKIINKR